MRSAWATVQQGRVGGMEGSGESIGGGFNCLLLLSLRVPLLMGRLQGGRPVYTNPDRVLILAPEPRGKFYALNTHCIYTIHAANMRCSTI
jgi:hypothetical protein